MGWMLALVLAIGVQATWANPRAATAELRALGHCAQHGGPVSLPDARACCDVRAMPSGPAETAAPASPVDGPIAAALPVAATPRPPRPVAGRDDPRPRGTGPPTFLVQRHLLI